MTDPSHGSLRVLMIEDVQSDADLLVRALTRAGFEIVHRRVETAAAMQKALADDTWDLILCDHHMPGFDAPGALAVYREFGLDIPFIVVSGAIGEETAVAMMREGAHDYVRKSNLGRLVPAIERELRQTTSRRERKLAEREQARRQQEIAAINKVVTATTATLDVQQILDTFVENLRTLSGADRTSIMLLDPKTDLLTAAAARGSDGPLPADLRLARGEGAAGRVIQGAKPLIVPDIRRFPQFVPPHESDTESGSRVQRALSYAGFPLVSRGRIIGVVSLITTAPKDFLAEEITFLETICGTAAVSIDNALAHQELQRRAEKLTGEMAIHRSYAENVLGSITDGVATTDTSERIVSWNPGAETIMGYTAEQAIGKPCSEIFGEFGANGERTGQGGNCMSAEIQSSGKPCSPREISTVRRNGQRVALSMSAAPLFDDKGKLQGIVRIFRDFTYERELLDNVQRTSRAKSVFLANMSHEIRTPMNAILGFSQILLKDSALSEKHRQHLDVIARSGEHLLSLIDDILEMSKIEAGRTPLAPTNFNLRGLLADVTSMSRLRADSKGLAFTFTVAGGVPSVLLADEKKIRQILINLLSNAIKFTDRGSVCCSVAARRGKDGSLWLTVGVEDTGPGVPAGDTERIFNAFEQTEVGTVAGGTGLGLAISRDFARLMGGDITLATEVGRGSRFQLDIPVTVGTLGEPTPVALRSRVVGLRSGLGPYHILVVDDRPENRLLAVEMLKAVGFQTLEASNGEEAITLASKWSPDAILMDVRMPGMDGLEAVRRLRALDPRRQLPIIAMSASAFENDRRQSLEAGASDFLGKPFRESELLEKVRAALGIEYVYLARTPQENQAPAEPVDVSARPSRVLLPAGTVEELRQAAGSADYGRIIEILDVLAATVPEAVSALREIAERFDYPELLARIAKRGEP